MTKLYKVYDGLRDEGTTKENDRPTQILDLIPTDKSISRGDLFAVVEPLFGISIETLKRDLDLLKKRRLVMQPSHGFYQRRKPS